MPDHVDKLCDLLRLAGARVTLDLGRNCMHPCTFCGSHRDASHELVRIGTYLDSKPLERPVCQRCMRIVDAMRERASRATYYQTPAESPLPAGATLIGQTYTDADGGTYARIPKYGLTIGPAWSPQEAADAALEWIRRNNA